MLRFVFLPSVKKLDLPFVLQLAAAEISRTYLLSLSYAYLQGRHSLPYYTWNLKEKLEE